MNHLNYVEELKSENEMAGQEFLYFIEPCILGSINHENWSFEEKNNWLVKSCPLLM